MQSKPVTREISEFSMGANIYKPRHAERHYIIEKVLKSTAVQVMEMGPEDSSQRKALVEVHLSSLHWFHPMVFIVGHQPRSSVLHALRGMRIGKGHVALATPQAVHVWTKGPHPS